MAGKISAKNAVIVINSQTVSGDIDSFEIEQDAGNLEVTGFGNASKNYIPGLPVYGITINGIYNSTATTGLWTVLKGLWATQVSAGTGFTVSITPEVGGQAFSGTFMMDALPVKGTPTGRLEIGSVKFSVLGGSGASWA
jgi:hypothetical protein